MERNVYCGEYVFLEKSLYVADKNRSKERCILSVLLMQVQNLSEETVYHVEIDVLIVKRDDRFFPMKEIVTQSVDDDQQCQDNGGTFSFLFF